jgi:hypothetical protein
METSITSSPAEYKAELIRGLNYNYEKLQHARLQPDNDELIAIFEHRVNNRLESIFELMGVELENGVRP